jgi:hypothetical protein
MGSCSAIKNLNSWGEKDEPGPAPRVVIHNSKLKAERVKLINDSLTPLDVLESAPSAVAVSRRHGFTARAKQAVVLIQSAA